MTCCLFWRPYITDTDTYWRDAIKRGERLAMALRFLASNLTGSHGDVTRTKTRYSATYCRKIELKQLTERLVNCMRWKRIIGHSFLIYQYSL